MSESTKRYSPGEVALSFAGQDLANGTADGDFFTCEPASESHMSKVGADGSVAFAVSLDRRANAKVVTLQTSATNAILGALHATGAVGPFEMRDLNGSLVVAATRAKIKKLPAVARGKEIGQLEWEIELFDSVWAHGAAGAV